MLRSPIKRVVLIGSAALVTVALGTGASLASSTTQAPARAAGTAGTAAARQPATTSPFAGTWNGKVQTSIPTSGNVVYRINPSDVISVVASGVYYPGMWKKVKGSTYSFEVTLPEIGANGKLVGFSYAEQRATMANSNKFTSSGVTTLYNMKGKILKRFTVHITATRQA